MATHNIGSIKLVDNTRMFTDAEKEAVYRALYKIGGKVVAYARKDVPFRYGDLRRSLTKEVHEGEGRVVIGSRLKYAHVQEFGEHFKHPKGGRAHFLRDAVATHTDEWKKILEDELKGVGGGFSDSEG